MSYNEKGEIALLQIKHLTHKIKYAIAVTVVKTLNKFAQFNILVFSSQDPLTRCANRPLLYCSVNIIMRRHRATSRGPSNKQ